MSPPASTTSPRCTTPRAATPPPSRFINAPWRSWEKALGPEHPHVATSLENYAKLLRKTERDAEAEELEARGKAIRARHAEKNP